MYHSVGQRVQDDPTGAFTLETEVFREQLRVLKSSQMPVVPFGVAQSGSVALTFDDGYRNFLTTILPELEKYGFSATFFVIPKRVQDEHPEFLTRADLKTLANHPLIRIGGHGYSHQKLAEIPASNLHHELKQSREWLSDAMQYSVDSMSYPHGSVNVPVARAAQAAGYRFAGTSYPGVHHTGHFSCAIPRTVIMARDNLALFRAKLEGRWDWNRARMTDPYPSGEGA